MPERKKSRRRADILQDECVACGCCVKVCPKAAIKIVKGICASVDAKTCIGCGTCAKECPAGVIVIREVLA